MGLQQLRPGGLGLHSQPAVPQEGGGQPAGQDRGGHHLRADLLDGAGGQRRGEGGQKKILTLPLTQVHRVQSVCFVRAGVRLGLQRQRTAGDR